MREWPPILREVDGPHPAAVWGSGGRPSVVFGFTIVSGRIVEIELLAEPARLSRLDLAILDPER